jgi:DNA replication and repair protein RecF
MSVLQKLGISKLRNISSAEIHPGSAINVIYGENGSGKSSFIEAIFLLGLARSFRSNSQKPLIQHNQKECAVFGELRDGLTLGLSKISRGGQQIKISGKKAENVAELARCLPLQLINADTFKILEGSPKERRHYLDWGVFHVEHRFIEQWKQARRALRNRNSLLKNNANKNEVAPWTTEFAKHAIEIDQYRDAYIKSLLPVLTEILGQLMPLDDMRLEYERGWEQGEDLLDLLNQGFSKDLRYGYTVCGPQRADLKIKIGQHYALDVLSRGQQKLLVCALKIAQGCLLERESQQKCIYLVDDLPSELDQSNREKACRVLKELNCQVFITTVEKASLDNCWENSGASLDEMKLFHVKHGKINEVSSEKLVIE